MTFEPRSPSLPARAAALGVGSFAAALVAWAALATSPLVPAVARWPLRLICHGIPARCLLLAGTPMPLCARCSGITLGIAGAAVAFLTMRRLRRFTPSLLMVLLTLLPLLLDGVSQAAGLRESTNLLRITTGGLAGFGAMLFALLAIERDS